jgi:DNA-binding transcriptional LysR family regulator
MVPPMELRQLRYFVTVADERNISRAAQKIFLTQPALSRQMKALEEEVGLPLFDRKANSIRLTPAGEVLLAEAREVLARADLALERVRSSDAGPHLRVGYAPSLAAGFLPAAVASFTQAHPRARVELSDLSSVEAMAGLDDGSLDVIITVAPSTNLRGHAVTALYREPWKVAMCRTHPLARRASVTVADLAATALVAYCRRGYPEYRDAVEAWFRGRRVRVKFAGEYDGAESLMAAVEAGLGAALVTGRMARLYPNRVVLKPLEDAAEPFCVAAITRADRRQDKVLGVFVEELRRVAKE